VFNTRITKKKKK